jgi:hemerythrin
VGIKSIDEQHKVWIERLNNLSTAIESHQESRHISTTLQFMVDYMEFHFEAEESYMEAQHYPGLAQHKLDHQECRKRVMDLLALETTEDGSAARTAESINDFQVSWLQNHIQQTDRKFAAFLQEKNAGLHRRQE